MDEDDLIKTGMEIALRPVTDVAADLLGLAGGDWLREKRIRTRTKLQAQTEDILKNWHVEKPIEPSPSVLLPLLADAQDESRESLQRLWAALLAATMDQNRTHLYRREFVEIVKKLEPIDILVMPLFNTPAAIHPSREEHVANELRVSLDQVHNSVRNLTALGLADNPHQTSPAARPYLTPLGRQLLSAISD